MTTRSRKKVGKVSDTAKVVAAAAAAVAGAPSSPLTEAVRRKITELDKVLSTIGDSIAKQRDSLRELIDDCEDIAHDCDGALADIESAIKKLSKLVGPAK